MSIIRVYKDFIVDLKEERVGSKSRKAYYKRIKTSNVSYDVKVTSRSRDKASGLTFEYRVFMFNEAEGEYEASGSSRGLFKYEGEVELEKVLTYNNYINFKTKPFLLEDIRVVAAGDQQHLAHAKRHELLEALQTRRDAGGGALDHLERMIWGQAVISD